MKAVARASLATTTIALSTADDGNAAVSRTSATLADVTERLMAEFEDRIDLAVVSAVVGTAWRDLQPVPTGSLAELIERLARQRLLDRPVERHAAPGRHSRSLV